MKLKIYRLLSLSIGVVLLISGCSSAPSVSDVLPDKKVEYKKEKKAERSLEVPPDLTSSSIRSNMAIPSVSASGSASYAQYSSNQKGAKHSRPSGIMPENPRIQVKRDGDRRWLVVEGDPEAVWPEVRNFWSQQGQVLVEEDPVIGIMETGWIENRADVSKDLITDVVRKFVDRLYSTGTRDRYRTRLEEGVQPGTTEIYLTHKGLVETVQEASSGTSAFTVWQPRPTDPELEAEMMRRLMVYLGVQDKQAQTQLAARTTGKQRSQLQTDARGNAALLIHEDFPTAWRLTGFALDRSGLNVEDRDRSRGIYYVRYADPLAGEEQSSSGLFSKLAFWKSDEVIEDGTEYQIRVLDEKNRSRVSVYTAEGVPDTTPTAKRILSILLEQIN
ncbi:MAG: outer membrane protein assembly factor BamC [gamma proteobacterium symbiont of Bathyaustriella thionipta]|nr:outer membrane protein assembly factor BamC [gamma proteobacterium symbiont of Bathyaustriella thionipta]